MMQSQTLSPVGKSNIDMYNILIVISEQENCKISEISKEQNTTYLTTWRRFQLLTECGLIEKSKEIRFDKRNYNSNFKLTKKGKEFVKTIEQLLRIIYEQQ